MGHEGGFKLEVHRKMTIDTLGGGRDSNVKLREFGYLKSSRAMMVVQSWTGDVSYSAVSHTFAWVKGVKGQCGLRPGGGSEEVP